MQPVYFSRTTFLTFTELLLCINYVRVFISRNFSCKFNRWKLISHFNWDTLCLLRVYCWCCYTAMLRLLLLLLLLFLRPFKKKQTNKWNIIQIKEFLYTDWMVWMQLKRQLIKRIWKRQLMNGKNREPSTHTSKVSSELNLKKRRRRNDIALRMKERVTWVFVVFICI